MIPTPKKRPKIRRLPEIDLARVATLSREEKLEKLSLMVDNIPRADNRAL